MVAESRHDAILRELRSRGSVQVTELAAKYEVAAMTISRDLERLERLGLLVRVHGGAVTSDLASYRSPTPTREPTARRPTATIGMITPSTTYYFSEIIKGARQSARERNCRLILGATNYSRSEDYSQAERMLRGGIDALMMTPREPMTEDSPLYRLLRNAAIPVVVIERHLADSRGATVIDSIRTDHSHGAEVAVAHLASLGHERVLLAARTSATAPWLREGHARALEALGVDKTDLWWSLPNPTIGADVLGHSLEQLVDHCLAQEVRAVIIHTDVDAVSFVDLLAERGVNVPTDINVVSYDDEIASLARVPLTAVAPPKWDLGYTASRRCFDRIRHHAGTDAVVRMTLLPRLIVRESTTVSV